MYYTINKQKATLRQCLQLYYRRMPHACLGEAKTKLTQPKHSDMIANEYSVLFFDMDKLGDIITVRYR